MKDIKIPTEIYSRVVEDFRFSMEQREKVGNGR